MRNTFMLAVTLLVLFAMGTALTSCTTEDEPGAPIDGDTDGDGDGADVDSDGDGDDVDGDATPDGDVEILDGDSEIDETTGEILPFAPAGPDAAPDPMAAGPFGVGVTTVDLYDDTRENDEGGPRLVRTEIWYPAVQSAKDGPFWSIDFKKEILTAPVSEEDKAQIQEADAEPIPTGSVRDAEIDRGHGPYPVVFFSHGQNGIRWQSVFFTEHLASHGYIVVSWDDEGNTIWELISKGFNGNTLIGSLGNRPKDFELLMDTMEAYNIDEESVFFGMADMDNIAVSGHSLGGITAAMLPCMDDRIDASIMHSPVFSVGEMVGVCPEDYPVPTMTMGGTMDGTIPWCSQYCEYKNVLESSHDKFMYELEAGGHFTFSDICLLDLAKVSVELGLGSQAEDALTDGCADFNAPYEAAHQSINHYATAFLNEILRGSSASHDYLIEKSEPPFDNVNFFEGDVPDFWGEGGCEACEGM